MEKLTHMKTCCIIFFNLLFFFGEKIVATENQCPNRVFGFVGFVESEKTTIEASSGDEHPKFTFSSCSHMAGSFPWRLGLESGTTVTVFFVGGLGFD